MGERNNGAPVEAPEAPKTSLDSAEARADLFTSLEAGSRRMADEKLGQSVDWDAMDQNPAARDSTIEDLSDAWDNLDKEWDRFSAVVGGIFGLKPKDVAAVVEAHEPALQQPGAASQDIPLTAEDLARDPHMTKEQKRAEHAANKLAEQPTWRAQIEITSRKYGIPVSTLVAFIEMESSFNPNSRPGISKKTGKPLSSATGLAQAMPASIRHYKQTRYELFRREIPGLALAAIADLTEPATAIDFMGWHILGKIRDANNSIDTKGTRAGFPPSYRLTTKSDVRYLYMAYNNGGWGYLVLRRYIDNPTDENKSRLTDFQRDTNDHGVEGWKDRSDYAERVTRVATVYELMNSDAPRFDSPPLILSVAKSSGYGGRMHPTENHMHFHNGVDYPAPIGTPVLAVKAGTVDKIVRNDPVSGNYIAIRHPYGISLSLHLSAFTDGLKVGDSVTAGMEIGKVGTTGRSTGPHLHFIWQGRGGITQNPEASIATAMQQRGTSTTS